MASELIDNSSLRTAQKAKGGRIATASLATSLCSLERLYFICLPALRPFHHFELYRLAFLQAAETARLDSREMHEHIFAGLTADEAVALGVVKPLHCSLFHYVLPFIDLLELRCK